jgi:MinD superfamily P-loop ATPase
LTTCIAIASGKGGTGKTTVAVNLASALAARGLDVGYLDCDVEEPNGHLFLRPRIESSARVAIPVPVVDEATCTACGLCAKVCEYHAIAVLEKPLVFPELCHGCGGCALACPANAIREEPRAIGVVETGMADAVHFVQGRLNVGEAMALPLIRAVRQKARPTGVTLLDAPPGTACPVLATVRGAHYVLLVTEPTPFGLHDLRLAVAMVRQLGLPCAVVVNRADAGDDRVGAYCQSESLEVLAELPDERRAAEACSRGALLVEAFSEWRRRIERLADALLARAGAAVAPRPLAGPQPGMAPSETAPAHARAPQAPGTPDNPGWPAGAGCSALTPEATPGQAAGDTCRDLPREGEIR